ncbi:MAG: hypothetical protein WDZ94_05205 [Patescibacteria group bacterium]
MTLRNFRPWLLALVLCVFTSMLLLQPTSAQTSLPDLKADIDFLRSRSQAVLFFNIWGDNPDPNFQKHVLTVDEFREICPEVQCEDFGANFATFFKSGSYDLTHSHARMGWALEIAEYSNPGAVSAAIAEPLSIIVRFGTAGSNGYDGGPGSNAAENTDPNRLIAFLNQIDSQGKTYYVIVGPNEPDAETWAFDTGPVGGGNCGTYSGGSGWAECVAPKLASYMNTVCDAKRDGRIPSNVRLLSPAFNMTSPSFPGLVQALKDANAPISAADGCLDGIAGNIYPAGQSIQGFWNDQNIESLFDLPIYITETGPWDSTSSPPSDQDLTNPAVRDQLGLPDIGIRDEDYYISPILGLQPGAEDYGVIRESLVRQGYQAYCAAPTYTVNPQMSGALPEYLDNIRAGLQPRLIGQGGLPITSTQVIDYTNAETPIFRDSERKRVLKADLEEYFGFKELEETRFSRAEIKSAPINSLLSETQRCAQTAQTLYSQEEMCNKLFDPNDCSLLNRQVPGTDYRVRQLLNEYKGFARSQDHLENCKMIVVGEGGNRLRTGMLTASMHLDRAYRIAFLVAAVAQRPIQTDHIFNFFSHSDQADPLHDVLLIAFKIPDIGTNKGSLWQDETATTAQGVPLSYQQVVRNEANRKQEQTESGHTYWDDPMTLSRNVLIPRKMAETYDLEGTQEREAMLGAVSGASGAGPLINCLRGTPPNGEGAPACNDHLGYAVVSMINGAAEQDPDRVNCSLITSEQVNEIGDPARFWAPGGPNQFQVQYGELILQQLWGVGQDGSPRDAVPFDTVFQINANPDTFPDKGCAPGEQGQAPGGDCTVLNFYLVYPMGYDLETLEAVLSQTFLTEQQHEAIADDPSIKDRFNVLNDDVGLDAGTVTHDFTDYLDCTIDPITGIRTCAEKSFELTNQSSQGPAQFFGARLGFWTHHVQLAFNRFDSLAHKYLRGCRTTEEFLLDQCGGPPRDTAFDQPAYCEGSKHRIYRDLTEQDTDRFVFFANRTRNLIGTSPDDVRDAETMSQEQGREIFFGEGGGGNSVGLRCSLKLTMRMIDGLTLIQTGGGSIVANNPGNQLGCTGTQTSARRLQLRKLPPDTTPPPDVNDPRWEDAPIMETVGSGAEVSFDLSMAPGYYWIYHNMGVNNICISNETYTMHHELGPDEPLHHNLGYVIDFTQAGCGDGACIDMNLQPAMEGGGTVYDENGNAVRSINRIDEWDGCPLVDSDGNPFTYVTQDYNNECGGGRAGDCSDEGGCGFWRDYINMLNDGGGDTQERKGYQLYLELVGRRLRGPGTSSHTMCTHSRTYSGGGRRTSIFANTINVKQCSNYSPNLDSLRLFGKVIGTPTEDNDFPYWNGTEPDFELPPRELWQSINAASAKHQCDPLLLLAIAHSENKEYHNIPIPNDAYAVGTFQFTTAIKDNTTGQLSDGSWQLWRKQNAEGLTRCLHQPPTFTDENRAGLDFSSPVNEPAAADSACRLALWTGMQKYYDDKEEFVRTFAIRGDNSYHQTWNRFQDGRDQGEYVWNLWRWLVDALETEPVPQPAGYPYPYDSTCLG